MSEEPLFRLAKGAIRKKAAAESLLAVSPDLDATRIVEMVDTPAPTPVNTGKTYVWPASAKGGNRIELGNFDPNTDYLVLEVGRHLWGLRHTDTGCAMVLDHGDVLHLDGVTPHALLQRLKLEETLPSHLPAPSAPSTTASTKPAVSLDNFLAADFDPRAMLGELDS